MVGGVYEGDRAFMDEAWQVLEEYAGVCEVLEVQAHWCDMEMLEGLFPNLSLVAADKFVP